MEKIRTVKNEGCGTLPPPSGGIWLTRRCLRRFSPFGKELKLCGLFVPHVAVPDLTLNPHP